MGIYYTPDGIVSKIRAGNLIVDASAVISGAAEIDGAVKFDGNVAICDATADTAAFFGKALTSRLATIEDPTASLNSLAAKVASVLDVLIAFGNIQAT